MPSGEHSPSGSQFGSRQKEREQGAEQAGFYVSVVLPGFLGN